MVREHPFCPVCGRHLVDVRELRRQGVKFISTKFNKRIRWIDKSGTRQTAFVATIHHIESVHEHRLQDKPRANRRENLIALCVDCHQKTHQEERSAASGVGGD